MFSYQNAGRLHDAFLSTILEKRDIDTHEVWSCSARQDALNDMRFFLFWPNLTWGKILKVSFLGQNIHTSMRLDGTNTMAFEFLL